MSDDLTYDLADVRKRPGIWFGSVGPAGISHVVLEVISNSFDEVLAGHVDRIDVQLHRDGAATISDS